MIIFYILISILFVIIIFCFIMSGKYRNPYRLYMVFGKKGSGKSTYMCKLAIQYHRKGRKIYSNTPLPYSTLIDVSTLGMFAPPPESVLLIDEVGMIWDNRNFKAFRNDVRDYFKLQRHYRNIVYLFSQTFDIDLKLRNLTDAMYLCISPLPFLSVVKRIKRSIVLVQPVADAEGKIADSLEFVPFWQNIFGAKALQLTYIPRWAKYFDSHDAPELQEYKENIDWSPKEPKRIIKKLKKIEKAKEKKRRAGERRKIKRLEKSRLRSDRQMKKQRKINGKKKIKEESGVSDPSGISFDGEEIFLKPEEDLLPWD